LKKDDETTFAERSLRCANSFITNSVNKVRNSA
jgi:hypothetical protein